MSNPRSKPKRITHQRGKDELIAFRLDKALFERVFKQCTERGISRSEWYREATRLQLETTGG